MRRHPDRVLAVLSSALTFCVFIAIYSAAANGNYKVAPSWDLNSNASSHASVLGVMTGFVAAVIVLCLPNVVPGAGNATAPAARGRKQAAAILFTALFHCVVGAFLYASFAGYPHGEPNQPTASLYRFVFDLIGIEYFLAVFLIFFGIGTLVELMDATEVKPLVHLFVEGIFVLGSFFVFLDFWSNWGGGGFGINNWAVSAAVAFCICRAAGSCLRIKSDSRPRSDADKDSWALNLLTNTLTLSGIYGIGLAIVCGVFLSLEPTSFDVIAADAFAVATPTACLGLGAFFFNIYRYRDVVNAPAVTANEQLSEEVPHG